MWHAKEGSTGRLLQLCMAYFFFYVITGVTLKYFQGPASAGLPGLGGMQFLFYSTLGGTAIALSISVGLGWYRLKSNRLMKVGPFTLPSEMLYIVPSGVCTAVVIPTTTLMFSLPISVMVAMVIMRGSVIVISRVVDAIQIRQGILKKRVYWDENAAVVFAILAVGMKTVWSPEKGAFEFLQSKAAMGILGSYIVVYSLRIYIMNYFKNTRAKGVPLDNKGFFTLEQITAVLTLVFMGLLVFFSPAIFGAKAPVVMDFRSAVTDPHPVWLWAIVAGGMPFGLVSFFSVFIFMFKGRTATFAGLVNRLTSLVAGTAATLVSYFLFSGRFPSRDDWVSLVFILVAVGFLTSAERKRTRELALAKE